MLALWAELPLDGAVLTVTALSMPLNPGSGTRFRAVDG